MTQKEAIEHLAKWLMVHDADCGMGHDYEATARLEYFKTLRANVAAQLPLDYGDAAKNIEVGKAIVKDAIAITHATIAALVNDDSAKPNVEVKA